MVNDLYLIDRPLSIFSRASKKLIIIFTFCVFFALILPVFASDEVVHNGKTYGIVSGEGSGQLYGGHLVTIPDASLNEWLRSTFFRIDDYTYNYLYIGLNYQTEYGTPDTDT